MTILFQEVTILNPAPQRADVLVRDGRIGQVAPAATLAPDSAERVVAGGCLSPGWVDLRAWVPEPGLERCETLEATVWAAAAGGFTAIVALPNVAPVVQTREAVAYWLRATERSPARVLPAAAVTVGTEGRDLTEMLDLHRAGAVAFTDGWVPLRRPDVLLRALQYLGQWGGLLMNRPEDPDLNRFGVMHEGAHSALLGLPGMPALAEEMMIARDLRLLRYVLDGGFRAEGIPKEGVGRLHFSTVSTAGGVQLLRDAKAEGLPVSADVAAHQLAFEDEAVTDFDPNYKVNPPFRTAADRAALREGLADGTLDAIVSDHRPYDVEQKQVAFDEAAFGITSLETTFAVARTHAGLSNEQLVEKLSAAPRRLLGLSPASIAAGQPAELTWFDPDARWTFTQAERQTQALNSPFFGRELTGRVNGVVRGTYAYFK